MRPEQKYKTLAEQVGTDISGKWISIDRTDQLVNLVIKQCVDKIRSKRNMTWQTNYLGGWDAAAEELEKEYLK